LKDTSAALTKMSDINNTNLPSLAPNSHCLSSGNTVTRLALPVHW